MKNIFIVFLLVTSSNFAQHTIKGTLFPKPKTNWVILYKIEASKQFFVANTTIKTDSILVDNKKEAIGNFEISLPKNAKPGAYRITYALRRPGFVDLFYNNEDIAFSIDPNDKSKTITFSKSIENSLYQEFLKNFSKAQQKLDSIQIAVIQNPTLHEKEAYDKSLKNIQSIREKYLKLSKNKYILPFVKATFRDNSSELFFSSEEYMNYLKNNFFNNIDFTNDTLRNASFLNDRISEYIYYLHYSEDKEIQQNLYKESIKKVLSKLKDQHYQKEIIEFLITQFENSKNYKIIDYLIKNYYDKLPEKIQDKKFKTEKLALLAIEIGSIAPDFSWTENGNNKQLSSLQGADYYVLVFWSTSCPHCLRQIPQLYDFMKKHQNAEVVAFALEKDAIVWKNYTKTKLSGWHHVLGLKKWENKIARTYVINLTPTYFVLDKDKKIIAKPYGIKDVKTFFESH